MGGKYTSIQFNINHKGTYKIDVDCIKIDVLPQTITPLNVTLPPKERDRMKHFKFVYNPDLKGTPARNYSIEGVIEYGDAFKALPFPVKLFVLCHEIGHFYYHTEKWADLYAAKIFVDNGYNLSTAIYSLTCVLNTNSARNEDRINSLFKNVI
jgi:hypothetical protein